MRFIHTADWHLGRTLYGASLLEDQAFVLSQLTDLVKEVRPDAVVISGDVYERAVPPVEAVRLLDEVLACLVLDLGARVFLISGNHDSADRISFGSRVLGREGLHVWSDVGDAGAFFDLEDAHGSVRFEGLPYADPAVARVALGDESLTTHDEVVRACVERMRSRRPLAERTVLLAHAFVAGGVSSESERPLSVGGAEAVKRGWFDGFSYVALGHLHRPQTAGSERVRYAGSLLKYSFEEAGQAKSVVVVEVGPGPNPDVRTECVELRPRRDVRRLQGRLVDLLTSPCPGPATGPSLFPDDPAGSERPGAVDDYLLVTLTDRGPVLDALGRLREVYPNVLNVVRQDLGPSEAPRTTSASLMRLDEVELFARFFLDVTGGELTDEERFACARAAEAARRLEGESGASPTSLLGPESGPDGTPGAVRSAPDGPAPETEARP